MRLSRHLIKISTVLHFKLECGLLVLLSLYALPTADLLAAEVTEATPEQQSTLDLPTKVLDQGNCMKSEWLDYFFSLVNF